MTGEQVRRQSREPGSHERDSTVGKMLIKAD